VTVDSSSNKGYTSKLKIDCKTAGFYAFLLLVADCSISEAGRWLMFGPLSIRMILGLISIICTIILIFKDFINYIRNLIKNPMVFSLMLFGIYFLVSAVYGYYVGNRIDVLATDLKGFAWVFIVPVGVVLVDEEKKVLMLMKTLILGSILHSIMLIIFNIALVFFKSDVSILMNFVRNKQIGFIDIVAGDLYRFAFGSVLFSVASIMFMVYFQMYRSKINYVIILATAICLFSLLISYTRSVYGAAFLSLLIFAVGYLIYFSKQRKKLFLFGALSLIVMVLLVFCFQTSPVNNYLLFGLKRTFPNISFDALQSVSNTIYTGASTVDVGVEVFDAITSISDALRNNTKFELSEMIKQNPILGNGLGASIASRPSGLVEYTYHDLLNKIGIVGVFLYLFPVLYMIVNLFLKIGISNGSWIIKFSWFCGLSTFLFASYYTPYMNNALGLCFYGLTIASFTCLDKKEYSVKSHSLL